MIRNPEDLYKKTFLPSRRLRIVLGIIASIAILIWLIPHIWAWIRIPSKGKDLPEPINPVVATPGDNYLDSDDDGIPDWKEHFIRTYGVIEGENGETNASETLSLLDSIPDTQKVALEIAAQVEAGGTSNGAGAITEQAITEYIRKLANGFKSYSLYDIPVNELDTYKEQDEYARAMQKASLEINKALDAERIKIILEAYAGSDGQDRVLQATLTDLGRNIEHLLTIPPPPSAVAVHLNLINSMYKFHQTLSLPIPGGQTDPVRSYALLTLAQQSLYDTFSAQTNLAGYFFITLDPAMY